MKYFCILLKSNKTRLNHVISLLKVIPSLTIFPSIEGKTNELEYKLEKREIGEKFLKFCRRGQLACLLSHLEVWKNMVKENIEEAVILEDDVTLSNNFTDIIFPKDADFIYLYVHPDCSSSNNKEFVKGYKTYGTVSYYIKLNLAKELITFFNKISTTVDDSLSWYLDNYNKTYYCANLVDTIGSLYFHKNEGIGSAIGETDLYKNNITIPSFYIEEEDYLFYPCCDCKGNIYFTSNINKEKILKDNKITGFTNNGWIKKSCEDIYINIKTNLYVKKRKGRKCILLTGGCGYIGSHTALEIMKDDTMKEYDLIIVDNLSNSDENVLNKLKLFSNNLYYYNYDITQNIDKLFIYHDIEYVIHFAAYKSVGESVEDPLKYYYNNISGLINLLQTMKKYNVTNIIFSSSATVYGYPESLPLTEESKVNTLNPYGRTKLFAEEILRDLEKDMKIICLRYFNPVGTNGIIRENPKGIPSNLFPYIIDVINGKREKLYIYGGDYPTKDGTAIRDYIHVLDLGQGHISALKYINKMDKNFDIFNLGTGNGYSVLEIVNNFSLILGREIPYEIVDRRKGDSSEVYADCSKALRILNWKAELTLENMISCLI